jgi:hypothetical protein
LVSAGTYSPALVKITNIPPPAGFEAVSVFSKVTFYIKADFSLLTP